MRRFTFIRPRCHATEDGAALAVLAACGLVAGLAAFVVTVDAVAPILHQQLAMAAAVVP